MLTKILAGAWICSYLIGRFGAPILLALLLYFFWLLVSALKVNDEDYQI